MTARSCAPFSGSVVAPSPAAADSPRVPHPTLLLPAVVFLFAACTGFREVVPGVYRSPQPTEDQLFRRIGAYDLRTVVCLRGRSDPSAASERATVGAGARFVSVPMSATRLPTPETLQELWQVAATAERPLLLHCRAGVDRTGLAAALVVLHDTGDLDRARSELSFVPYGHTGLMGTRAMDDVLELFAPYHRQMSFPQWLADVYPQLRGGGR